MNSLKRNRTGIWKYWFLRRGENRSTREENLSEERREPTTNSTHILDLLQVDLFKFFAREASFNEVTQRRRNNQPGKKTKQEKILKAF